MTDRLTTGEQFHLDMKIEDVMAEMGITDPSEAAPDVLRLMGEMAPHLVEACGLGAVYRFAMDDDTFRAAADEFLAANPQRPVVLTPEMIRFFAERINASAGGAAG